MTNPPLPTAAEALRLAFDIVKTPCSAAEAERARVLLGIAVELRTEAQWQASRLHRTEIDQATAIRRLRDAGLVPPAGEPPADAKLRGYLDKWQQADAERYAGTYAGAVFKPEATHVITNADITAAMRTDPSVTQVQPEITLSDVARTQRLPIVWQVGDKSQCRNCHTPIKLVKSSLPEYMPPTLATDPERCWRHKYTEQAACAVPATAGDLEGSEPTHTFAQPLS